MREQIETRLKNLEAEFKTGQDLLAELETRQANVRGTLLRIDGAIQVLRELLKEEDASTSTVVATQAEESVAVAR